MRQLPKSCEYLLLLLAWRLRQGCKLLLWVYLMWTLLVLELSLLPGIPVGRRPGQFLVVIPGRHALPWQIREWFVTTPFVAAIALWLLLVWVQHRRVKRRIAARLSELDMIIRRQRL